MSVRGAVVTKAYAIRPCPERPYIRLTTLGDKQFLQHDGTGEICKLESYHDMLYTIHFSTQGWGLLKHDHFGDKLVVRTLKKQLWEGENENGELVYSIVDLTGSVPRDQAQHVKMLCFKGGRPIVFIAY